MLPPLDAMATGLPTIVTTWSVPVDYADPDDTLLGYRMGRAFKFDTIYLVLRESESVQSG